MNCLWTPSDWHTPTPCHQLIHAAPLMLSPEAHQCWSEISPLAASKIFTQRKMQRIAAGSMHSKGSMKFTKTENRVKNLFFFCPLCSLVCNVAFLLTVDVESAVYRIPYLSPCCCAHFSLPLFLHTVSCGWSIETVRVHWQAFYLQFDSTHHTIIHSHTHTHTSAKGGKHALY